MLALVARLAFAIALLVAGTLLLDAALGTDLLGAIARWIAWFWLRFVDLFVRVSAKVSLPLSKSLSVLGKRALIRSLTKPLWRLLILLAALFIIGKSRRDRAERWVEEKRLATNSTIRQCLAFKPDWPRGVRAAIAACVIALFVALFLWISVHVGKWWGLGASIVLWMIVEKVQLVGLDALLSWMVEKWAPVKAFIDKRPIVRWLWLGPAFDWLARSLETFSEQHGDKHEGRSSIEVWRERRRRRLERLRAARKRPFAAKPAGRENDDKLPSP